MSFGWLRRLFPSRPKASAEQARQLQEQGAILLDVRKPWSGGPGMLPVPGTSRCASSHSYQGPAAAAHRDNCVPVRPPVRGGSRAVARKGRDVVNLSGGMQASAGADCQLSLRGRPGRVL